MLPELTEKELGSTDFPGSFKIPGTDAAIRFGGQIRTILVRNLGALGTEDRFVTSSIPIEGTPEASKSSRTTLTANPSRFETDFRTPTAVGPLRAYLSGDFAGSNRTTACGMRSGNGAAGWSARPGRPSRIPRRSPTAWTSRA